MLVALALAGEAVLRLFPSLCPVQEQLKLAQTAGFHEYVDDPDLGARPRPLAHDTVRTPDYRYLLQLDSLGFPNREPWPRNPDVAVLGNSLATGPGVGLEGQFTTLVARAVPGTTVLNLGLPGGSPMQELRMYDRFVRPLHPRTVIATLWVASDVDNAVQFTQWLKDGAPPDFTTYRMTFGTTHRGREMVNVLRDALSESYLLRAIYYEGKRLTRDRDVRETATFPNGETIYLSVRAQQRLAQGAARPGFDLESGFVAPLVRLRDEARADGARFVVALLPSKEETYGAATYPAVLHTVRAVRAALDAAQLPVLDLYGAFRDRARQRPLFFTRDIHFTASGNALVAGELARWIAADSASTSTAAAPPSAPGNTSEPATGALDHGA
ncbi:MAG TPA: hypothetical protein VFK13_10800 [Gemmatimonadaceae bacterium]|nr:hypothetical protein [Gemmatimonadaceae bacterium]